METNIITSTDSPALIFSKMAKANPGAMNTIIQLYANNKEIDPGNFLGPLGAILQLDKLGIYGTDIYVLASDICNKNISKMIAVLRAVQLGLFDGRILAEALHRQDYSGCEMVPVDELYAKVKERLPMFDQQLEPYKPASETYQR